MRVRSKKSFNLLQSKEYLLELRNVHRSSHQQQNGIEVCAGAIVHNDNERRSQWRLGLVEESFGGRDGKIRGAVVKISERSGQSNHLRRPEQRLYPVEFCVGKPVAAQFHKPTQASSPERADDTIHAKAIKSYRSEIKKAVSAFDTGRL